MATHREPTSDGQPPRTVSELILLAEAWGSRTAVSFPEGSLTYTELVEGARRRAARLIKLGVMPGDHVALLVPDGPRGFEALCGCWLAGAVPVPLHTRFRADEIRYLIEHSDAVGLVLGDASADRPVNLADRVERALPELPAADGLKPLSLETAPKLRFILPESERDHPWQCQYELDPDGDPPALPTQAASSPALMLYTSGTTSRPKGCVLTHERLVAVALAATSRLGFCADDVVWSPTPSFHIGAYMCLLGTMAVGGEYLGAGHFDPERALAQLIERQATVAFAVFPPLYLGLVELDSFDPGLLKRLRVLTTAAAPAEIERIRRAFPDTVQVSVFGSTEASGTVALNAPDEDADQRLRTCGRPTTAAEIAIRAPHSGANVSAGTEGEICIRGSVLSHYHRDSTPVTDEQGWFHTGDLGSLDREGRLAFRGRLKEMLKVGGENVSPSEVEDFLMRLPEVKLAQVVGVPDSRLGEVPAAFIELEVDATLDSEALIDVCRARIAGYKVPRHVRFVSEWPRSATKIRKPSLREQILTEIRLNPTA